MSNTAFSVLLRSGKEIKVSLTEKFRIPCEPTYCKMNLQGGCTDGKYGYFLMNECGNTPDVRSVLHKIDLATGETVGIAKDLYFGHGNDIAYDAAHDRMVVSHCGPKISIFDPHTLTVTERREVTTPHYATDYNPKRGIYVVGKSLCYDFAFLDADFNCIGGFEGQKGDVKQGISSDDEFIYFLNSRYHANCLLVYDWEGNFITRIELPLPYESEHLFPWGGGFLAGFFNHDDRVGAIYEMKFYTED